MQLRWTYCGRVKKLTDDHVFPRCLFISPSNDRSIMVRSCGNCNWSSDEGLLKSVMMFLDKRILHDRMPHFKHPKGMADLRKLFSACHVSEKHQVRLYPDDQITKLFKKMFVGLRKHLLGRGWTFLEVARFTVFKIDA